MRTLMLPAALLAAAPAAPTAAAQELPMLLPTPVAIRATGAGFVLTAGTRLVASDAGSRNAAARLAELMATQGVALGRIRPAAAGRAIRFVRAPGLSPEAYRLETDANGATVSAADDAGLFYGAVTLWQLATQDAAHRVAGVAIDDRPRFRWRGLMLDSARHYQSAEYIRHLIDWMAVNKLNRLHWHLVDDQGWRLPVPGYPRLTTVSAWRRDGTAPGAPPLPVDGGIYTREQIRGLVAHAAARGVTIVPEIEMPGHALAAIRAYPKFGMGVPVPPGAGSDYGVFPWLYNTDDVTFRFLQAVLGEVIALFPSRDIHVGGDEAVKDQWRASPAIRRQIRALGLKDEDALQGWFMARIGRFLAAHGRRLVGWDEILDGAVPADATITSWRGTDGAVRAAKSGHDAILSPSPLLYLDHRQGTGPAEPPGRGAPETLGDLLAFEPVPAGLSPAERTHILGLQANLWTEHVRTEQRAALMMFPRALAIAEIGWASAAKRDVAAFAPRLVPQLARMAPLGLAAADSAFAVLARFDLRGSGAVAVTLAGQSGLPIRYTLDGSAPGAASSVYAEPLVLAAGQRLRAATFLGAQPLAGAYDRTVDAAAARTRTSTGLEPCTDAVLLNLEDDYPAGKPRARFLLDIFHPCWRWRAAPLEGARRVAIDVGQIPFNFQVGADRAKIRFRPPATPAGEFEVRAGDCDGAVIATLPLAPAVAYPGVTRLTAPLPPRAMPADLCISYTARGVNPLWAIDRITLLP